MAITKPIKVVKNPEDEIPVEVLERSIVEIAEGMRRINATRLNRRALVALIQDSSGLPKTKIEIVLNTLGDLESIYLKKEGR